MKYILLLILFCNFIPARAQTWQQLNNFPGGRRDDAIGFSVNGKGYVGTGRDDGFNYRADFWEYDPVPGNWRAIAPLPGTPRQYTASFVIGDTAYVFGGLINDQGDCLAELWAYHPETDSWARKPDLPASARQSCVAFSVDGKGYIAVGRNKKTYLKDCWQYDPQTSSWLRMPDFPGQPRYEANVIPWLDGAFVGAGKDSINFYNDIWKFCSPENTWRACSPFPYHGLYYSTGFSLSNRGYYITGEDHRKAYPDKNYRYNPFTDSWDLDTPLPALTRRGVATFSINNEQYIVAGLTSDLVRSAEVWKFTPSAMDEPKIYPNPCNEMVVIETGIKGSEYIIYDLHGRIVKHLFFDEQCLINTSQLPNGLYFCRINRNYTGKLVVE